jgi:acetyltransferase-like isoleucine patch superfamily enzyme
VLFILFEDYSYAKTYINDIGATSDTLYIELKKYTDNEEFDIDNNIISVKIDKDLNRENLEIYTIPNEKPTSNEYIELEKIPLDYNKEKAIEDNCFVVENREIISNDKNQLDNFVEKTQNGENAFIRIVEFTNFDNSSYETIIIRDVEYRNGVFLIAGTEIDEDTEKLKISYYTGTELEVKYAKTVEDGPWTEKIYRIKLEDTLEENKKAVICHLKM